MYSLLRKSCFPSHSISSRASLSPGALVGQLRQKSTSSLVTPEELADALAKEDSSASSTASRVIPLCAAWFLPNDPQQRTGRSVFRRHHIPSARFFDLDEVKDHGSPYPHMLPKPAEFAAAMSKLGIRREDRVVVYDSAELGIFSAPRALWTLRIFGHPQVQLLNNYKLWVERGYPVEVGDGIAPTSTTYPVPDVTPGRVVDFDEVKDIVSKTVKGRKGSAQIVDARSRGRWLGVEPEPRPGLSSGHMPGSLSLPLSELLDPLSKTLLPKDQLRKSFEDAGLESSRPVISSCGTGVTAAVVDLALEEAGYGSQQVYDGSWTEWAQRVSESDGLIQKEEQVPDKG